MTKLHPMFSPFSSNGCSPEYNLSAFPVHKHDFTSDSSLILLPHNLPVSSLLKRCLLINTAIFVSSNNQSWMVQNSSIGYVPLHLYFWRMQIICTILFGKHLSSVPLSLISGVFEKTCLIHTQYFQIIPSCPTSDKIKRSWEGTLIQQSKATTMFFSLENAKLCQIGWFSEDMQNWETFPAADEV